MSDFEPRDEREIEISNIIESWGIILPGRRFGLDDAGAIDEEVDSGTSTGDTTEAQLTDTTALPLFDQTKEAPDDDFTIAKQQTYPPRPGSRAAKEAEKLQYHSKHRRIRIAASVLALAAVAPAAVMAFGNDGPAALRQTSETVSPTTPATIRESITTSPSTTVIEVSSTTVPVEIPEDATTYVVKAGNTFSQIAHAKGLSVQELLNANHDIVDARVIRVGQIITFPTPIVTAPTETVPAVEPVSTETIATDPPVVVDPTTTEVPVTEAPVQTTVPTPKATLNDDGVLSSSKCADLGGSITSIPDGLGTNAVYNLRYLNPLGDPLNDQDMYRLFNDKSGDNLVDTFKNRYLYEEGECLPPQSAVTKKLAKYYASKTTSVTTSTLAG